MHDAGGSSTAAQQHFRGGSVAAALMPRSDEQLRQSFNHRLYAIKLSNACRMYGVVQPAEKEGSALFLMRSWRGGSTSSCAASRTRRHHGVCSVVSARAGD